MAEDTKYTMIEMSKFMLSTCRRHAHAAHLTDDTDTVLDSNMSILFLAPSVIEATFNEFVSISSIFEDRGEETNELFDLLKKKEREPLYKRWNKLSSHLGGTEWNKEEEPFCYIYDIKNIRNGLVHFKGDFLPNGEAPSKDIERFLRESCAPVYNDCPWTAAIISHPDMALWAYETTLNLCFKMPKLLNAEDFQYFEKMKYTLQEELVTHLDGMDLIMSDQPHMKERKFKE